MFTNIKKLLLPLSATLFSLNAHASGPFVINSSASYMIDGPLRGAIITGARIKVDQRTGRTSVLEAEKMYEIINNSQVRLISEREEQGRRTGYCMQYYRHDPSQLEFCKGTHSNRYNNFKLYTNTELGQDNIFDKPVYIIDGLDPNSTRTMKTFFDMFFPSGSSNYGKPQFQRELNNSTRDIVFINTDSRSDISNSSEVFKRLLLVDKFRHAGMKKSAVIGYSMGGLIARKALADLESKRIDHNVSFYGTLDTPHRGANTPYQVVEMLRSMKNKLNDCRFIPECSRSREKIAASLDSLVAGTAGTMSVIGNDVYRTYEDLARYGQPLKHASAAFSNGNGYGRNYDGSYGEPGENKDIMTAQFDLGFDKRTFRIKSTKIDNHAYKGYYPYNSKHFDYAPGSYLAGYGALRQELSSSGVAILSYNNVDKHSFIPTVSALDINSSSLNTLPFYNSSSFKHVFHGGANNYPHDRMEHHTYELQNMLNLYH
ncbi:putative lipase [Pseudoalteromonas sp. Of7M-16]|uniref:putative lipase n=1 Tax=Pseudoalteromonas sp. Of7M-16 TaxID=2917756 RepID=UPI001EF51294|nr:putative lipase [Pseudoalteromonas sp. Of7M-16]MCG7550538.1 putative lipase [Pseudoalteromonas sp. Of7M-16]